MFTLPDLDSICSNTGCTMYMALYNAIKDAIIERDLAQEEKLPSKRVLANKLGISVKTVENAYNQLELEGFIFSKERTGYYVSMINEYLAESKKNISDDTTKYNETRYKVNLRANRNSIHDFPSDTWCKLMRETLSENTYDIFKMVPFNGAFKLRKAIANHLRTFRGMEVSPDQIIVASGTEYMYSRLVQIFGYDIIYALPDPCSKRLHELYSSHGIQYLNIPADEGIDTNLLTRLNCQILHLAPAHQHPLGKVMPIDNRLEVLKWVDADSNRYIIEDDYDSEYVLSPKPVPPLYTLNANDKIIYINTFSKSVSPAVRISYMVLPEKLMKRYLDTMSFYACTVANVEQYTLTKFIEKGHLERYIRRINRKNFRKIKPTLLAELEPLVAKGKVEYDSNSYGAMILLKVNTNIPDADLKKYLKSKSIITSMMSEYYSTDIKKKEKAGIIVLHYSGMTDDEIKYFCDVLDGIENKLTNQCH